MNSGVREGGSVTQTRSENCSRTGWANACVTGQDILPPLLGLSLSLFFQQAAAGTVCTYSTVCF